MRIEQSTEASSMQSQLSITQMQQVVYTIPMQQLAYLDMVRKCIEQAVNVPGFSL